MFARIFKNQEQKKPSRGINIYMKYYGEIVEPFRGAYVLSHFILIWGESNGRGNLKKDKILN